LKFHRNEEFTTHQIVRARGASGDGDGAGGRLVRLLGVGEVLGVVDNGEEEGAGRAPRSLLTEAEVRERDLEEVAAGARIRVRTELLVPLHVLDLHLVVRRHLAGTLAPLPAATTALFATRRSVGVSRRHEGAVACG
jgi:hypothetical protein